jgi:hypothetical protein
VIARQSGADIAAYQETARLDPKNAEVHNGLAWLLATGPDGVRDGKQAIKHATRACELTGWKEPNHRPGHTDPPRYRSQSEASREGVTGSAPNA